MMQKQHTEVRYKRNFPLPYDRLIFYPNN